MKKIIHITAIAILFFLMASPSLMAQSEGNRMSFGINAGGTKYWGEFTDNQFWLGGDMFLRYNIIPQLSVQATVGLGQIRWKTDQDAIDKYPTYFGPEASEGDIYPGTEGLVIRDKNSNRIITYEMYFTYNFFSSEKFVPYLFVGIGAMNHEPKAGDSGFEGSLPNNQLGTYDKTNLIVPFGFGYEMYISDNFVFNGRATLRMGATDYLDDLSLAEDQKADDADDMYLTFGVGFSYYILGDADYDNDGLTNSREKEIGTDPHNPDTDGDGLKDGEEVYTYHTDPLKPDTDADNITDYDEVFDTRTSPVKADTDADGLNDGAEIARKTDPNIADTDGDGLIDGDEINKHETDALNPDTDGDGLTDGEEVNKYNTSPKAMDSDKDGLNDGDEVNKHKTNPAEKDSDADGLSDGLEINTYRTDPMQPDTDKDGLIDGKEVDEYGSDPLKADSDADGLTDGDEVKRYKTNPMNEDSDKDGLKDGDEVNTHKTDPSMADSDEDGLKDGDEVNKYKTNPLNSDSDGDNLADGEEVNKYRTDPLNPDTDGETLTDGHEVNKSMTDPLKPDTDDDSVNDAEDDCPLIAGKPSTEEGKNGCPQAPKIGTKMDFPDILFVVDTDKFNFDHPGTARNLAKLLEYVNQCEGLEIMIEGHASLEGDADYNQQLSERRAARVRDWLMKQGVDPKKISGFIGYGESQPKVPEPTGKKLKGFDKDKLEEIRKQNRRITIEVTKTCQEGAKK